MEQFADRLRRHAEHVGNVGSHCTTEETTKQALILPLLDILNFSPFDPTRVKAEFGADFPGAKAGERVDYALFCHNVPVMFIEAKPWGAKLTNHAPQLARYFNATPEVTVAAITNGAEWRFFTDLNNKNVMDSEPFLIVDFTRLGDDEVGRLARFRHDEFQPDALRTLAEESIFLEAFKSVVRQSVLACDADFVRFIAGKSNVQRTLTARFVESVTPIVQQAVAQSMSERVADSIATRQTASPVVAPQTQAESPQQDTKGDLIDPTNSKIVTSYAERRLLEVATEILGETSEVSGKDTESYYALLFQGKTNRWLLRYWADRKQPGIQVCVELTADRKREIARAGLDVGSNDVISLPSPEHLMRLAGIVFDSLDYCRNDENFRKKASDT